MAVRKIKRYGRSVVQKGKLAKQHIAKRSAAILFVMIIVIGILLPAGIGLALEKMGNIGVDTLVASSADTNSSVILSKASEYWDGQYYYYLNIVSMDGWDYVMTDTQNRVGQVKGTQVLYRWRINASKLKDIDKIVVYYNAVDGVLKNNSGRLIVQTSRGDICYYNREYDNATGAYKIEVPITPNILLKSAGDSTVALCLDRLNCEDGNPVGRTYKARIELYDTKGISANSTKTIFLAGSGILMLIAGLCATPWINPSKYLKRGWF